MAEAVVVALLVLSFAAPIALYVLVRAEHDEREEMDREAADRAVRRDTRDDR